MTRATETALSITVIVAVLAGMLLALLAMSPSVLFAAGQPELQIAPLGAGSWSKTTNGTWEIENLRPGTTGSGGVSLRLLNPTGSDAMLLNVTSPNPGPLLDSAVVASMTLDGIELLPLWSACANGELTVAEMKACATRPALPAPSTAGSTFRMSFTLGSGTPNAAQGTSTGTLRFEFVLLADSATSQPAPGTAAPPSGGSPDAAAPPSGGTGSATPPAASAPGTGSEAAPPPPASAGHGLDRLTSTTEGLALSFAVLATATGVSLLLLAASRRRREEHA